MPIPVGAEGTVLRVVGDGSGPFDCIYVNFGAALNPDKLISMSQAAEQIAVVLDSVRTRFLYLCVGARALVYTRILDDFPSLNDISPSLRISLITGLQLERRISRTRTRGRRTHV